MHSVPTDSGLYSHSVAEGIAGLVLKCRMGKRMHGEVAVGQRFGCMHTVEGEM